jgi:hypothetical protein
MVRWRKIPQYANFEVLIHALGLRRDRSRSRTHALYRTLEYVPGPRKPDIRDRVRVAKCGVFELERILPDFAQFRRSRGKTTSDPEEEYQMIQDRIDQLLTADEGPTMLRRDYLTMIEFTVAEGITPSWNIGVWLFTSTALLPRRRASSEMRCWTVTVPTDLVMALKYEPDWRQYVNGSNAPPAPLVIHGVPDVEHEF